MSVFCMCIHEPAFAGNCSADSYKILHESAFAGTCPADSCMFLVFEVDPTFCADNYHI